ncbi:triose-phosphate isomerase [Deferribacterales bacterium RsTz2092]|nr:triosephosphate isomerase [Deferribacterales bacterium]
MRRPLIAANWKMFLTPDEGVSLVKSVMAANVDYAKVDVLVSPSFTSLYAVFNAVKVAGKPVSVAAQNICAEDEGAFTGEVSLQMVKGCGAGAVILGHSERRNIFSESDELINKKAIKVLSGGLTALLCVGELLNERESGKADAVVVAQLDKNLKGVKDLSKVVIAYEPVWAIGTGKTATPADAEAMHKTIRTFIGSTYGVAVADNLRILYGGSVKPDNISMLMKEPDIDGALVGGASLKADQFLKIINY